MTLRILLPLLLALGPFDRMQFADSGLRITSYGARSQNAFVWSASCTAGSPNLMMAYQAGYVPGFRVGDFVVIHHCGPKSALAAPQAPTVISGQSKTLMVPDARLAPFAGNSAYQYRIFSRDYRGGTSASSPVTVLRNGPDHLGPQSVPTRSASLTGQTLTIDTAAPVVVQGAIVSYYGSSNATLSGYYHARYVNGNVVTAVNLPFKPANDGKLSSTGGQAVYYVGNQISWRNPPGAFETFVCAMRPGDASFHIIGVAHPVTYDVADHTFTDWGPKMTSVQGLPAYITDANCTATIPGNQYLSARATEVSGRTLTVDTPASSEASGTLLRDDGPALVAAMRAAHAEGMHASIPAGLFVVNTITTLPSGAVMEQYGVLALNEPIIQEDPHWFGTSHTYSVQFSLFSTAEILVNTAYPGFLASSGAEIRGTGFEVPGNGLGLMMATGNGESLSYLQFQGGGPTGIMLALIGPGGTYSDWDHLVFNTPQYGMSTTPAMYLDYLAQGAGEMWVRNVAGGGRGMYALTDPMLSNGGFLNRNWNFTDIYMQGCTSPILAVEVVGAGYIGLKLHLQDTTGDTSPLPHFAAWAADGNTMALTLEYMNAQDPSADAGRFPENITGIAPRQYFAAGVSINRQVIYPTMVGTPTLR